ncbi:unnamed protein product, partial [Iphiclides podalirius]
MQQKQTIKCVEEKYWNGILNSLCMLTTSILSFSQLIGMVLILIQCCALDRRDQFAKFTMSILLCGLCSGFMMIWSTKVLADLFQFQSRQNRQLLKVYLLCSALTLVTSISFNFLYGLPFDADPAVPLQRGLSVLMNIVYLIYFKISLARRKFKDSTCSSGNRFTE